MILKVGKIGIRSAFVLKKATKQSHHIRTIMLLKNGFDLNKHPSRKKESFMTAYFSTQKDPHSYQEERKEIKKLIRQGKSKEALRAFLPLEQKILKEKGNKSSEFLGALSLKINLKGQMLQFQEKIPCEDQAIQIAKDLYGQISLQHGTALSNKGVLLTTFGKIEEALTLFEKSKAIYEKCGAKGGEDEASIYENVGLCHSQKREFEKALDSYNKCLQMRQKIFKTNNHPEVTRIYEKMAIMKLNAGKAEEALKLNKQCLRLQEETFGKDNLDQAKITNRIANCYAAMKNIEEARVFYNKSLETFGKTVGEDHFLYGGTLSNMALLYIQQKNYEDSLAMMEKAHIIFVKDVGEDHPHTKSIKSKVDVLRNAKQKGKK